MSIDKRPNGKWRVRHPGVPSKTFDRKADAQEYEAKVRRAKQNGTTVLLSADKQTLADLSAEWIGATRGDLEAKTLTGYLQIWAAHVDGRVRLKPTDDPASAWAHPIADMTLRQITPEEVEKWRDSRIADGGGRVAVRRGMSIMQTVLDRAVRYRRIESNPVRLVTKPKIAKTGGVDVVTPESVERIRAELDDAGATLVSLLAYAGVRPGEARALKWKHIGDRSIRIEWGTNPDGTLKATKTEHKRSTRLLAPLAADLAAWKKKQGAPPADALVFPRADGTAWTEDDWNNWRGRKFLPARTAAGVAISRPYDLRHSAASLWIHEGINPVQVAAWLGHNVSETFKTYAHVVAELDPAKPADPVKLIARARKKIAAEAKATKKPAAATKAIKKTPAQDTSRTHRAVQGRAAGSRTSTPKPRRQAVSAPK